MVSAKVPLAFAFRKAPPRECAVAPPAAAPATPKPAPEKHRKTQPAERPKLAPAQPVVANCLDDAFALADQGRLMEAAALCEEHMRAHGPSASAFYLMGLICSADGRLTAADRCYRKALYLDQNHHDALVHLALLLEQQGDAPSAKRLRSRAQKQ
jgi:chemotaxis protein methyltransferase WspC